MGIPEETTRKFPIAGLEKTSYPIIPRRKNYEIVGFQPLHGSVLLAGGKTKTIKTINALIDFIIGRNCITSCDNESFHSLLSVLGGEALRSLVKNRYIEIDGTNFYLNDAKYKEIMIRRKNEFGYLKNLDEIIPVDSMPEKIEKIVDRLQEKLGVNISGSAKMAQELILKQSGSMLPYFSKDGISEIHLKRAYRCFRSGRLESFKLGSFDKAFDYDLKKAYAMAMRKMPAIGFPFMRWVDSDRYMKNAVLGFVYVEVTIPPKIDSPIAFRYGVHNYYPTGTYRCWCTKTTLDLITKTDSGSYKILQGSWGIPSGEVNTKVMRVYTNGGMSKKEIEDAIKETFNPDDVVHPFEEPIDTMLELLDDKYCVMAAKGMLSRGWGKFASCFSGHPSLIWNPFYAAEIPSIVAAQVYETSRFVRDEAIGITIDGIISESKIPDEAMDRFQIKHKGATEKYSDLYHIIGKEDKTWEVGRNGVITKQSKGVTLDNFANINKSSANELVEKMKKPSKSGQLVIPFGSSVRKYNKKLTLDDIKAGEIPLPSPTIEDLEDLEVKRLMEDARLAGSL